MPSERRVLRCAVYTRKSSETPKNSGGSLL